MLTDRPENALMLEAEKRIRPKEHAMWEWITSSGTATSLGILLVGTAVAVLVGASVIIGVASVWMRAERGAHVLLVMDRLTQLVAALRGKPPPGD
jgi:hypothetical protein